MTAIFQKQELGFGNLPSRMGAPLALSSMNTKLYVGNLPFKATEEEVTELFSACGPVSRVEIVMDRESGRPRGFAFVTMATPEGAQKAVGTLSGQSWQGRDLIVNEARPREERPPRGGEGGGFRGGKGRPPRY
jgi:cold-inducible RNA-binding protein